MDKVLTISGKEVGFRATALTPRIYRHKIGRDIIQDLNRLRKSYAKAINGENAKTEEEQRDAQLSVLDLEIFENAAYVMAKQYDPDAPASLDDWLDGFETFSIYEILPEILQLWSLNERTTAKPKKK
ncbi:hypothetical protein [Bittarella massiliensis (ex Durand et al. 2017)]|uniref:hypothetical protein n=1 Tax=Bittarella massiliensis (ex Durand et al. 2017) TaxID=1720313 RepID=UPI00073E4F45|nr:hypothetical protein [Bittarella massiliensis (ex Durand et al. 2017)]